MVSRKRNKGKERKAKKKNEKAERRSRWERLVRGENENNRKVIHCDHGCTVTIPDDPSHPVVCFMDEFFVSGDDWLKCLNSHAAKLWSNDNRKMVIDLLLSLGTNLLLGSTITNVPATVIAIASTIVVLDNYKETMSMSEVSFSRGVLQR